MWPRVAPCLRAGRRCSTEPSSASAADRAQAWIILRRWWAVSQAHGFRKRGRCAVVAGGIASEWADSWPPEQPEPPRHTRASSSAFSSTTRSHRREDQLGPFGQLLSVADENDSPGGTTAQVVGLAKQRIVSARVETSQVRRSFAWPISPHCVQEHIQAPCRRLSFGAMKRS